VPAPGGFIEGQSPASLIRGVPSLTGWAASTGAMEADVFMAIISVQVARDT